MEAVHAFSEKNLHVDESIKDETAAIFPPKIIKLTMKLYLCDS